MSGLANAMSRSQAFAWFDNESVTVFDVLANPAEHTLRSLCAQRTFLSAVLIGISGVQLRGRTG
jgi:hypothetical protein